MKQISAVQDAKAVEFVSAVVARWNGHEVHTNEVMSAALLLCLEKGESGAELWHRHNRSQWTDIVIHCLHEAGYTFVGWRWCVVAA